VRELLARNNIQNYQGPLMKVFEDALKLYFNKHYSAALDEFQKMRNLYPEFPYINDYISSCQAAILRGEDVPGGPAIDNTGKVVGVATFVSINQEFGQQIQGFNFFMAASLVREILARNNIQNYQGPLMKVFEDALKLYFNKHYSAALEEFQKMSRVINIIIQVFQQQQWQLSQQDIQQIASAVVNA
jgi:TolA-binding protein